MAPRTLFDKLWDAHVVGKLGPERALIHIDRHMLHDVTSPQAFSGLRLAGRRVRNPELTFATADHIVATEPGRGGDTVEGGRAMIVALRENAAAHGIVHFDVGDARQGIVHVIAPELGIALPGLTLVCGDSHTCTVGALGAWAWGIGTSEVEHVLATQVLAQERPRTMRVAWRGRLAPGVAAKDMVLHLIGAIGTAGATGYALEFAGEAVRALDMEGRFALCNMGVEAGARAALVAPDDTTFAYVAGRPFAPRGADLEAAMAAWRALPSDPGARYGRELELDAGGIAPQITWGTSPEQVAAIDGRVPDPAAIADSGKRQAAAQALAYMGLAPGTPLEGIPIDRVFIGSCTNSRLADLEAAAAVLRGRKVAPHVKALAVPGSGTVKRAAEARGLDRVFRDAGFDWREPGCSMCAGLNADKVGPRERCVATINRNFEGRQGPLARTHLASPAMAAAAAVAGAIVDVRRLGG
jgi:3-isopropylmalate/(R)-2-methylmalate dehydratase large subunit